MPAGYVSDGIRIHYHLLVARDEAGTLVGVRDCFVTLDDEAKVVVVFLSHSLVVPAHRRTGLAAILRGVPATLGRVAAAEAWGAGDVLLAAEMEPVQPTSGETLIRLLAYGRAGFFVVDPACLPYLQPDFGDVSAGARPVPLIPVVRWLGEEHRTEVPGAIAYAFDRHLHAVHARYVDSPQVEALKAFTLAAWAGRSPVPVFHLPRSLSEAERFAPILKSRVLPLYSSEILGVPLPLLDSAAEREALARVAATGALLSPDTLLSPDAAVSNDRTEPGA